MSDQGYAQLRVNLGGRIMELTVLVTELSLPVGDSSVSVYDGGNLKRFAGREERVNLSLHGVVMPGMVISDEELLKVDLSKRSRILNI